MSRRIVPGDYVVLFSACMARRISGDGATNDYVWLDRGPDPHMVIWTGVRLDPDTADGEVGILLYRKTIEGVYAVPHSALVHV